MPFLQVVWTSCTNSMIGEMPPTGLALDLSSSMTFSPGAYPGHWFLSRKLHIRRPDEGLDNLKETRKNR